MNYPTMTLDKFLTIGDSYKINGTNTKIVFGPPVKMEGLLPKKLSEKDYKITGDAIGLRRILADEYCRLYKKSIRARRIQNEVFFKSEVDRIVNWKQNHNKTHGILKESELHPRYSLIISGEFAGLTIEEFLSMFKLQRSNRNYSTLLAILTGNDKKLNDRLSIKGILISKRVNEYVKQEIEKIFSTGANIWA